MKPTTSVSTLDPQQLLQDIVLAFEQMRQQQPLVHYITNSVAANYVANILLAAGASPALIDNPFEAADFVQISAGLNINLGTPTTEQMQAMQIAAETAHANQTPWVLDPVGYGPVLKWRSTMVDQLLESQPTIIRGNASEISTLAGQVVQSKGVDSTLSSEDAYLNATNLFAHTQVVAISGETDFILSKAHQVLIKIKGGSFLQPKVTATGCALGGLLAAYAAVAEPTIAAVAAHVHFAIAGQRAYRQSPLLGQFNVAFMDMVYALTAEDIRQHADFEILTL
jgi:hydroxyethylthiazole kinase